MLFRVQVFEIYLIYNFTEVTNVPKLLKIFVLRVAIASDLEENMKIIF